MADLTKILHMLRQFYYHVHVLVPYDCVSKKMACTPIPVPLSLFAHVGDHQASTVPFQNVDNTFYSTLGIRAQNYWRKKGWIREETWKGYMTVYRSINYKFECMFPIFTSSLNCSNQLGFSPTFWVWEALRKNLLYTIHLLFAIPILPLRL